MASKRGLDRRAFIAKGGLAVAGATLAVSSLGALLSGCKGEDKVEVPTWPYTWTKLDPEAAMERSYLGYKEAG